VGFKLQLLFVHLSEFIVFFMTTFFKLIIFHKV
jgi:hypothetical protein